MSRFTKRKQWLGNEEKKTPESDPVPRAGAEDHQPWSSKTMVEKSVGSSTMEQLLKGIEDLKINGLLVRNTKTNTPCGVIAPRTYKETMKISKRCFNATWSTKRVVGFIPWTPISQYGQISRTEG